MGFASKHEHDRDRCIENGAAVLDEFQPSFTQRRDYQESRSIDLVYRFDPLDLTPGDRFFLGIFLKGVRRRVHLGNAQMLGCMRSNSIVATAYYDEYYRRVRVVILLNT
jgi:hypothetical protein